MADTAYTPLVDEVESSLNALSINKAATPAAAPETEVNAPNPDSDKYTRMVDWLINGGSHFPKLYLKYYSYDYRGIHAKNDIGPEETIVSIPYKYIMTTEIAKESIICRRILSSGCLVRSKHSYLAAFLLEEKEKGEKSFWFPYIDVLPVKYSNKPINFTQEEYSWLKGSFSLEKIRQQRESLEDEYANIVGYVPEFSRFTVGEFMWARHVVITRIFGMVIGGLKTEGLVPLADLLNHKHPRDTKWTYDNFRNAFTITTCRFHSAGEQVYDSYGRKCNHRFFVNYGFSLEENEDNEVVLRLGLSPDDSSFQQKLRLLGYDASSSLREFQIPASTDDRKDKELMSYGRFVAATTEEMNRFPSHYSFMVDDIQPINKRNEIAMLKLIKKAAQDCLDGFDCSVEEDNELLKRTDLTFNIRNCILMRRGEKQVAQFFIDLADAAIPLLEMNWQEFLVACEPYRSGHGRFDNYVQETVRQLVRLYS
jgi:histone-lysine N-methyltransferase SETD3